jgi:predicted alpha/beta hydrolase family esterase
MPNEDDPSYASWTAAIRSEISAVDDAAILIGHSLGGTFLISALAEYLPGRELGAMTCETPTRGASGRSQARVLFMLR